MVGMNEIVRTNNESHSYSYNGIKAIHSGEKSLKICSWICHNNTTFCKKYHVKIKHDYLNITDPFYFGIIGLLKGTGSYGLANVLFLVIIFPFAIFYMTVRGFLYKNRLKSLS
jgi:hypothetical protein